MLSLLRVFNQNKYAEDGFVLDATVIFLVNPAEKWMMAKHQLRSSSTPSRSSCRGKYRASGLREDSEDRFKFMQLLILIFVLLSNLNFLTQP